MIVGVLSETSGHVFDIPKVRRQAFMSYTANLIFHRFFGWS